MITRCSLIIRDVQARAVWFADVDSGLAGSRPLRRVPPLRGSRLFHELTSAHTLANPGRHSAAWEESLPIETGAGQLPQMDRAPIPDLTYFCNSANIPGSIFPPHMTATCTVARGNSFARNKNHAT